MKLYFYYLSSYSQKALMAFFEKDIAFTAELMDGYTTEQWMEYGRLHPIRKVPLLQLPSGELLSESSVIIEYLDAVSPSPRMLPAELLPALHVRQMDRTIDYCVNEPFVRIFQDRQRPEKERDPRTVAAARELLDRAYLYLDGILSRHPFAAGESFSLADCAAAPALSYSGMVHPFEQYSHLHAYFARLKARPSFVRIEQEVAPRLARLMSGA